MKTIWVRLCVLVASLLGASGVAHADDSAWLPVRDQNPFVLGSGLPLLPTPALRAGNWSIDATLSESNTQLISSRQGLLSDGPGIHLVFGAETRESRIAVNYAFDNNWSARASLGDEWIGVGFLDRPIQDFHKLIGSPRGFRGGRLGEKPPVIRLSSDGDVLYALDRPGQALAPLLLDLTRTWNVSDSASYGVSLGVKLPTGDSRHLSDTGDNAASLAAFGNWTVYNSIQVGARVGYLYTNGNDVLPTLARSSAPFADVYVRAPLIGKWSAQFQFDVHGALYRNVPIFLDYAGMYTFGFVRPIGARSELLLGVSEDLPIGHTQDVSLLVAFRYRPHD
ncbi:MAG TPA: DUF3187 family protein [Rudaea sp.]|uniref:DUF3187 family protein n=1 Tax=Rudaea sp. TaxID=2136325 RepID=UPI002F946B76